MINGLDELKRWAEKKGWRHFIVEDDGSLTGVYKPWKDVSGTFPRKAIPRLDLSRDLVIQAEVAYLTDFPEALRPGYVCMAIKEIERSTP